MLQLSGKVMNILDVPAGISRRDNKPYEASVQVQLLCETETQSGEKKMDLVNLKASTSQGKLFDGTLGQDIAVPVRAYAMAGSIGFSLPAKLEAGQIVKASRGQVKGS